MIPHSYKFRFLQCYNFPTISDISPQNQVYPSTQVFQGSWLSLNDKKEAYGINFEQKSYKIAHSYRLLTTFFKLSTFYFYESSLVKWLLELKIILPIGDHSLQFGFWFMYRQSSVKTIIHLINFSTLQYGIGYPWTWKTKSSWGRTKI